MRKIYSLLAWLAPISLIGGSVVYSMQDVVKPSYASEIADQEIAALNKAAPKFPRKALLPGDVKVLLDNGHSSAVSIGGDLWLTAAHVVANPSKRLDLRLKDGSIRPAETSGCQKSGTLPCSRQTVTAYPSLASTAASLPLAMR